MLLNHRSLRGGRDSPIVYFPSHLLYFPCKKSWPWEKQDHIEHMAAEVASITYSASYPHSSLEDAHFSATSSHAITYTGLTGENQSHLAHQMLVKSVILPAVLYCKLNSFEDCLGAWGQLCSRHYPHPLPYFFLRRGKGGSWNDTTQGQKRNQLWNHSLTHRVLMAEIPFSSFDHLGENISLLSFLHTTNPFYSPMGMGKHRRTQVLQK